MTAMPSPPTLLGEVLRFVGRTEQRSTIAEIMRQAAEERHGRTVLVIGEAGMGKDAMLQQIEDQADLESERTWMFLRGRSYTQREPHHLLGQATKASARIPENAPLEEARERLVAWAERFEHPRVAAWCIGEILGVPVGRRPAGAPTTPHGVRNRAYRLLRQDIIGVAERTGMMIILRDAHWADAPSLEFFAHLMAHCEEIPLVLVVSAEQARPDPPGWLSGLDPELVLMGSLTQDEATNLVRESTGVGLPDAVVQRIVDAGEGRPWALLEAVRLLDQLGVLMRDGPSLQLRDVEAIDALPADPAGLALARIQRLSPTERAVASVAAVMGREFSHAALRGVVEQIGSAIPYLAWSDQLGPVAERLVELEWIHPFEGRRRDGLTWFRFVSRPMLDALVAETPTSQQILVNAALAAWMERATQSRANEWLASIAGHYEAGEQPEKASDLYRRAGAFATSMSAPHAALRLYARALAVGGLGPGARAAARFDAAAIRGQLGQWARARRALAKAEREAQAADRSDLLARALTEHARIATLSGAFDEGEELGRAAVQAALRCGDLAAQSDALQAVAAAAGRAGRREEASKAATQALELDAASIEPQRQARVLAHRADQMMSTGDLDGAIGLWNEACDQYRDLGQPLQLAGVLHSIGIACQHQGRLREAIAAHEESLDIRRSEEDLALQAWNLHNLSHIYRELGEVDRALELHVEEIAISRSVGNEPGVGYGLFNQGMLQEHAGEFEAARASHQESLEVFERVGEPARQAFQHLQLARISRLLGDFTAARTHLGQVDDPASLQELLQERAELALAQGDPDSARAALAQLPQDRDIELDLLRARAAESNSASELSALCERAEALQARGPALEARALWLAAGHGSADQAAAVIEQAGRVGSAELAGRVTLILRPLNGPW